MGLRSAPPAPSAPPPHKWGGARIMGLRSAPRAPSAPPPHKWGGVSNSNTKNEAAPAADAASTGNPPGDTRLVFCAALRPLPTCGGQPLRGLSVVPDGERIASTVQRSGGNVKGFGLFLVYYI